MHCSFIVAATMVAGAYAQSTTIKAILGTATSGFAASVVSANNCETVLALACTDSAQCVDVGKITITQGPYTYAAQFSSETMGGSASISANCDLQGPANSPTSAVCHQVMVVTSGGQTASTSTSTTIPGNLLNYQSVSVTAGASSLTSATGSCSSSSKAAAPTVHVIREVYKVLVPVIVAGVLI